MHLHTYDLADGSSLTGQPALKVYAVDIVDGKVVVSTASPVPGPVRG